MPRVISSVGHSNMTDDVQKKIFTIPDETNDGNQSVYQEPQEPQQISQADVAAIRAKFRKEDDVGKRTQLQNIKNRVDIITGIGRKTKDVKVVMSNGQETTFSLRTLKSFENRLLSQVVEKSERARLPNGDVVFLPSSVHDIRIEALKHSLFAIDNIDIDVILSVSNLSLEERLISRQNMLEDMDDALIAHLFSTYEKLSKETLDSYGIKDAKDAEAAAEAIHKSG